MKKFISVALCLCMMLLAVPFSVSAAQTTPLVLENGVYTIDEYADFAAVASVENYNGQTFVLGNDIYVTTAITKFTAGFLPEGFAGVLDGKGNSIIFSQNTADYDITATDSCGIIADKFAGTLKNITIGASGDCVTMTNSSSNVGIISNQTDGAATLENVTVYADITMTKKGAINVGGFFGKNATTDDVTFINCHAYGAIRVTTEHTDTKCLGAFIGQLSTANKILMINCSEGVVYGPDSDQDAYVSGTGRHLGGFIGYSNVASTVNAFNCVTEDGYYDYNEFINGCTVENVTHPYTLNQYDAPETLTGASIRYITGTTGMRFDTEVKTAMIDALDELFGKENIKFGTIVCPYFYVQEADHKMTHADIDALGRTPCLDIQYKSRLFETSPDGKTTILTGAITNIKDYEMQFIAVGYVSVEINGETIYIYSDLPMEEDGVTYAARTVKYVATEELAEINTLGEANVENYATKVEILNTFING